MAATTHLLYLHGFRSSPQSTKARHMAAVVQQRHPSVTWWCPALPVSPAQAMALLMEGLANWPHDRMAIMGSSLGGFYAACLSQQWGCPAVLINPVVFPARDLSACIGVHSAWHDPAQKVFFEASHVAELQALQDQAALHPARTLALIAKGDEVLDWREMWTRHRAGRVRLIEGSDHALSDFGQYLPEILEFLDLA